MNNEQFNHLLMEAEKAFINDDKRQGYTQVLKILSEDFLYEPAWKLLHKVMGGGKPFGVFQMEIAKKYFPNKAHLLVEKEFIQLLAAKQVKVSDQVATPYKASPRVTPDKGQVLSESRTPSYCIHCGNIIHTAGTYCAKCGNLTHSMSGVPDQPVSMHERMYPQTSQNQQPTAPQQTDWNSIWKKKNILPFALLALVLIVLLLSPLSLLVVGFTVVLFILFLLQKFGVIGGRNIFLDLCFLYLNLFGRGAGYFQRSKAERGVKSNNSSNEVVSTRIIETPILSHFANTYFVAELGLVLLIFSFLVPWFDYEHTTFLIFSEDQTFYAKTLMATQGSANFDITVLFFYLLTCFAYLLSFLRNKTFALLCGLGAIGFQIYTLNELNSISNFSDSRYDYMIPESMNTSMGNGGYVAIAAVIFIVIGILISIIKKEAHLNRS